jgi:hypothetical protein
MDIQQVRERMLAAAREIQEAVHARENPHPALQLRISCKIDRVQCREELEPTEIVGGALLSVGAWAPRHVIRSEPS